MAEALNCWKCGETLQDILLPLSRYAKCKACQADLHSCRMCEFFDKTVSKQCREPVAEAVKNKVKANFCGYLQPSPDAFTKTDSTKTGASQPELESLFGMDSGAAAGSTTDPDKAKQQLDDLFGLGKK